MILIFCGDSWTRTNDPIDVNDVLSLCRQNIKPFWRAAGSFDFKGLATSRGTHFFAARVRIWLNILDCPTSLFTSRRCERVAFVDVNSEVVSM